MFISRTFIRIIDNENPRAESSYSNIDGCILSP